MDYLNLCYCINLREWIYQKITQTSSNNYNGTTSQLVEQAFFVSERDKGDYNNLHVHILIGTNTDMTYQEVKYGMGNVSVGDYQSIYDSEAVCKYVTKHIGKDVDYDIVFKS